MYIYGMGRPALSIEIKKKILEMAASGASQRAISRAVNLARTSVFNVLNPVVAKARWNKYKTPKRCARIIELDRQDLPEGCFNVNERTNWAI